MVYLGLIGIPAVLALVWPALVPLWAVLGLGSYAGLVFLGTQRRTRAVARIRALESHEWQARAFRDRAAS